MSLIFDIKRFAINDGPGIRTTIFMKGCPLHCVWCHNPESIDPRPTLLYTHKKCIGCQSCVEACPQHLLQLTPDGIAGFNAPACQRCGRCTEACPSLALEMAGRHYSIDELMSVVEKERQVMEESGGGVTLCGGEPLFQIESTVEILKALGDRGIHRCVDTSFLANEHRVMQVGNHCELFLIDLKHMDSNKHRLYTGWSNEVILSNIYNVSQSCHPFWIRIPLIVGINDDDENLTSSARFIDSLPHPPEVVNLLVYHDVGKGKHARMGTRYNPLGYSMQPPTVEQQEHALDIFRSFGINAIIGG